MKEDSSFSAQAEQAANPIPKSTEIMRK